MAELVWECLIVSLVLLFGVNIGLAMGLTEIRKKEAIALSISYGLVTLIISILANFLNNALYSTINYYIFAVLGIIGVITLLSGIHHQKMERNKKRNLPSSISGHVVLIGMLLCRIYVHCSTFK